MSNVEALLRKAGNKKLTSVYLSYSQIDRMKDIQAQFNNEPTLSQVIRAAIQAGLDSFESMSKQIAA